MLIRGQAGGDTVILNGVTVGDRLDINTGSGPSETEIRGSTFGRTHIRGGSSVDDVGVDSAVLGLKPLITTGNGDDRVELTNFSATDRLAIRSGSDIDNIFISEDSAEPFSLNVNTGAHDDIVTVEQVITPADLLIGGSGTGDELHLCVGDTGADIRQFEVIGVGGGCD